MHRKALASVVCLAAWSFAARSPAEDWPRFRGPDGLGVSSETALPEKWSKTEGVLWRASVPGWGNSSPIVVGGRVYLTSQTDDKALHVHALDARDGSAIWSRQVGEGMLEANKLQNMATPTAVADGAHVWALFGTGDLACLDAKGEVIWKRDLRQEHGEYTIKWGMGSSPIAHEDRVLVVCMDPGPSYLLAMEKKTGKDIWKTPRDLDSKGEARESYSTPLLFRHGGRAQIVLSGADHVDAYDPATGKRVWSSSGLQVPHPYGRSIASPAAEGETVIAVASGFRGQGHAIAVRAGGSGDVTGTHRRWKYDGKHSPDCSTPVCYRGLVYMVRDNGVASCLDLKTGKAHWEGRLLDGDVKASPIAGDGKVYFTAVSGESKVLRAGTERAVVAESDLGETTLATPAISGGRLYVRTKAALYCIGKDGP